MTDNLKRAMELAERVLPASDQDALARMIEEEIKSAMEWDAGLQATLPQLAEMGARARAEYRAGRTKPLNIDDL